MNMLKKYLSIFVVIVFLIIVYACNNKNDEEKVTMVQEHETILTDIIVEERGDSTAPFHLSHPVSLECDAQGNIYVFDAGNYCIVKYSDKGKYLKHWGSKGLGPGQFMSDLVFSKLFLDESQHLYATSALSSLVNIFNTDGKLLQSFRVERPPLSLVTNQEGLIFITYINDIGDNRLIHVYDSNGKKISDFGDIQTTINNNVKILNNAYLTIDQNLNLYVSFGYLPYIYKYNKNQKLVYAKRIDFSGLRKYSFLKFFLNNNDKVNDATSDNTYGIFSKGIRYHNNKLYIDGGSQIWVLSDQAELLGLYLYPRDLGLMLMPSDLRIHPKNGEFIRTFNGNDSVGVAFFKNHFK